MSLNQITKIRLPDGREVAFVDWTDRPIYSTIEVLHGTAQQEMNLFTYTVGDPVPAFAPVPVTAQRAASELDTNMQAPGSMASTEEMLVYAIKPEVFRRNVEDEAEPSFAAPAAIAAGTNEPIATPLMYSVLSMRTTLNLEISDKLYASAGFGYFQCGFGPTANGGPIAATQGEIGNNGVQSQDAVRSFVLPQYMGGQEKFRVFLRFVDDGTGNGIELGLPSVVGDPLVLTRFARIRIYMDGLNKRPTA